MSSLSLLFMCSSSQAILCLGTVHLTETERLYCGDIRIRMRQEAIESHRKIVIIYLLTKRLHILLHFFPCHSCASLPRRDGGVGRYSRSALPIPSPPGLPQHWPPAALTARWGPLVLLVREICCAVSAPGAPLTHDGAKAGSRHTTARSYMLARHTNNTTITACKRRVWRCTTTEKFSFHASRAA